MSQPLISIQCSQVCTWKFSRFNWALHISRTTPSPISHIINFVNYFVLGNLKKKPKPKIKLTVSAKGVPQRKLQLVKTPGSNLPRHPMPFAAKNMYYDERWIEKQGEGNTHYVIPRGLSYHVNLRLPVFMIIVLTKKCSMSGDKTYIVHHEIYNIGEKYFFSTITTITTDKKSWHF